MSVPPTLYPRHFSFPSTLYPRHSLLSLTPRSSLITDYWLLITFVHSSSTLATLFLLPRHGDLQPLLRADKVIMVVLAEVDLHPVDLAGEGTGLAVVVGRDRRAALAADVCRLVGGKYHGDGLLNASFAHLPAVVVERDLAALGQAAAVVGKLHPHLVLARWDCLACLHREGLETEEVVSELCLSSFGIKAQTAKGTALGDHDALCALRRHLYLSRDREGLVLHHHDTVLAEPAHAAEEQLRVSFDQGGTTGQVRIETLGSAVVKRQDVVFDRFDQEQALELVELLRHSLSRGRAPASSLCSRRTVPRHHRRRGAAAR